MSSPAQAKMTGNGIAEQAKKTADSNSIPKSTPAAGVLMAAACGVGVICGILLFYVMYRSQCAALLTEKSVEFNATMERLQSMDDKKHIERQKHLLNQQAALTERHQNLLERLAESQNDHEATKRLLQEESERVKTLENSIREFEVVGKEANAAANQKLERLQRQLELARTMLQEKVDEVEDLKANVDEDTSSCPPHVTNNNNKHNNNEAYFQLQSAVRRQNAIQLGLIYGRPPYMVQLYLKNSRQSAFSVEVQISSTHEMPHAIHSFLSLIKAGLFLETSLVNDGHGRLVGGSPASSPRKQVQSKLSRQYAEQGYSTEPLLFTERSSQVCQVGSLGWIRHGPSLVVFVQTGSDDDYTCFGRIASGFDSLKQFMDLSSDERLLIVDARVVMVGASHHEEL